MKTVVIDENKQSRELILNILKNIQNIDIVSDFETFSDEINYNNVDLVIFDINSKNSQNILEKIEKLKTQFKNLNFIAQSYEINSQLVNQTLKLGVNDFLLKPVLPTILETSIKKINLKEKKAKTITIFSGKGGIGKTSLVTNLAWELHKKTDEKVCILDLSFSQENVNSFLNIEQKYNTDYILSNIANLNEQSFLSFLGKYKNSKIYTFEIKEELNFEIKFSPQVIIKIINSLKNIFDYILIDTTSLINETNVSILNNSDLILLLTLGNQNAIKNCQKSYELFDKIGYSNDKIKLIVNRFIDNNELTINDIEKTLDKNVFNTIPNNYLTLIDAINLNCNVDETNPQSNIAKAYSRLAQNILDIDFASLITKTNQNHGIYNLLKKMGEE